MNNSVNVTSDKLPDSYFFLTNVFFQILSFCTCFTASGITINHIYCHLRNYTCERQQRYIIRLLLIVPAYCIYAFISILLVIYAKADGGYVEFIHDIAEAFTIYSFLVLCYEYVGGEGEIMTTLHSRSIPYSIVYGTCCFAGKPYTILFFRCCKILTLQYTFIKPITAIITLILICNGHYVQGNFSPSNGYLWMFLINNFTVSLALYGLLLFYHATRDMLKDHKPMLKFMTIKAIIFFSFWQGVLFSILELSNVIVPTESYSANLISEGYKNFVISVELIFVAITLRFAFPYQAYVFTQNKKLEDDMIIQFDDQMSNEPKRTFELFNVLSRNFFHKASSAVAAGTKPQEPNYNEDLDQVAVANVKGKEVKSISAGIKSTMDPRDVIQDAIHNFHPAYRHYTQYNQRDLDD